MITLNENDLWWQRIVRDLALIPLWGQNKLHRQVGANQGPLRATVHLMRMTTFAVANLTQVKVVTFWTAKSLAQEWRLLAAVTRDAQMNLSDTAISSNHQTGRMKLVLEFPWTLKILRMIQGHHLLLSPQTICPMCVPVQVGHLNHPMVMHSAVTARIAKVVGATIHTLCAHVSSVPHWQWLRMEVNTMYPRKISLAAVHMTSNDNLLLSRVCMGHHGSTIIAKNT